MKVKTFIIAYFIYFLWKFITTQITPKLNSTSATLIKLIDRVRMLDNDLIRLRTKVKTFKKK